MKHTLLALALCAALVLGGCGQQDRRPATGTNVAPGVTDHNGSIGTNGGDNNGITGNGTENGVVGSGTNGTGTDGTLGGTAGTSIYGAIAPPPGIRWWKTAWYTTGTAFCWTGRTQPGKARGTDLPSLAYIFPRCHHWGSGCLYWNRRGLRPWGGLCPD